MRAGPRAVKKTDVRYIVEEGCGLVDCAYVVVVSIGIRDETWGFEILLPADRTMTWVGDTQTALGTTSVSHRTVDIVLSFWWDVQSR